MWLTASALAFRAALRRNFKLHQEWMTRSYVVLSALLFKVPAIGALGTLGEVGQSLFWFSWAVPLYVYEAWRAKSVVWCGDASRPCELCVPRWEP